VEGLERRVFEGGSAQTGGEPGADGGSNGGAGAGSEAQPR
jgi:hypothetical protein